MPKFRDSKIHSVVKATFAHGVYYMTTTHRYPREALRISIHTRRKLALIDKRPTVGKLEEYLKDNSAEHPEYEVVATFGDTVLNNIGKTVEIITSKKEVNAKTKFIKLFDDF
jgi:hypothetical protein